MMCCHLMILLVAVCPSYHIIPTHFLNGAFIEGYYSMHLFPVSPSLFRISVSLHMYFVLRVCRFVCSSLLLRILVWCHWKNRLSNFKLHYAFIVPHFWLVSFAWGFLIIFSKSFLLQLFCLLIPIWVLVCVGCYCDWFLFVGMVQRTLRKLGRCQMTQLI